MTIYVENFGKVIAALEQKIRDLERRVENLESPPKHSMKYFIRKAGGRETKYQRDRSTVRR